MKNSAEKGFELTSLILTCAGLLWWPASVADKGLKGLQLVLKRKNYFAENISETVSAQFEKAFTKAVKEAKKRLLEDENLYKNSYKEILDNLKIGYQGARDLEACIKKTEAYLEQLPSQRDVKLITETLFHCFEEEMEYYPELKCNFRLDRLETEMSAVWEEISEIKENMQNTTKEPRLVLPGCPPAMELIGRGGTLNDFKSVIAQNSKAAVVTGIGGIGKTEFIKRFLADNASEYSKIGWFDYHDSFKETLLFNKNEQGVEGRAEELVANSNFPVDDTENRWHELLRLLNELDKNVVLVFDNVDDVKQEDFESILKLKCSVIFTTRLPMAERKHTLRIYPLDFLTPEDCARLFEHYYDRKVEDAETLQKIVVRAGCHTLALELLAKTCKTSRRTIGEFYEELQKSGFNLEGIKEEVMRENGKESKRFIEHMTKLFSLAAIEKGSLEEHILKNLCTIPLDRFDIATLRDWLGLSSYNELESLNDKGWIRISEDGETVTVHNVVAEVLAIELQPVLADCENLLASLWKSTDYEQTDVHIYTAPYLRQAEGFLACMREETEEIAALSANLAFIYDVQGDYGKAEEYYRKALEIVGKILGQEHPDTATIYNNLALVYQAQGYYRKAEEYYRKALKVMEKILGQEHPDTATIYNNLAGVYQAQGDYGRAEEYYRKALKITEKILGQEHPDTAMTYDNLARVYKAQGDYGKAEEYFIKALRIREKVLGQEHPDTAATYNNLAVVYRTQGDYRKAEKFYQKDLEITEKVLGQEHPSTATTYNNLAGLYQNQGDYGKAEEFFIKALRIREKVLGQEHPSTATTYNNLAVVYQAQGYYKKAEEYYKKALGIREKVLGREHPDTATMYNNLAVVYQDQGDYGKAEEYYRKALKIIEKVLGQEHPNTATTYNNLAGVYKAQGDYRKAEKFYQKDLEITEKVLGQEHPSIATTYNNLALVYQDQGGYGRAEEYYRKALKVMEKILGQDHPDTATTYHNLAGIYQAQGDYGRAEEYYRKALGIREKVLGREHPDTAAIYNNLAGLYQAQGGYGKAFGYYLRSYKVLIKKLGHAHPNTQIVHDNFKTAYEESSRFDMDFEAWLEAQLKE